MTNATQGPAWNAAGEPYQLEDWADGFVRPFPLRRADHRQGAAPYAKKIGSFDRYNAIDKSILPEDYPTDF